MLETHGVIFSRHLLAPIVPVYIHKVLAEDVGTITNSYISILMRGVGFP